MRKKLSLILIFFITLFVFNLNYNHAKAFDDIIYLGGIPAGFSVNRRGTEIVGLCDVLTKDGTSSPSKAAGLKIGDVIYFIDNIEVNNALDIENAIKNKKQITTTINRNGNFYDLTVLPALDLNNNNKLGIFIRDCVCGVGTITYVKGNKFSSLGHPIIDNDGNILNLVSGELYPCKITGFTKGERGKAGELKGVFSKKSSYAKIDKNLDCGVFGFINENFDKSNLKVIEIGDAVPGSATIYTTINGCTPKEYEISIIKIDTTTQSKNFVVKIVDKELLESTNGIVQGMSGSPIVQNKKLVGAITHVFINDPTRGFGIDISKMLSN